MPVAPVEKIAARLMGEPAVALVGVRLTVPAVCVGAARQGTTDRKARPMMVHAQPMLRVVHAISCCGVLECSVCARRVRRRLGRPKHLQSGAADVQILFTAKQKWCAAARQLQSG